MLVFARNGVLLVNLLHLTNHALNYSIGGNRLFTRDLCPADSREAIAALVFSVVQRFKLKKFFETPDGHPRVLDPRVPNQPPKGLS